MKATGIVRRIDDLGRVVIPKEIRRTMRIREGDPLEIYTDKEGGVIFKKYSLMGGVAEFAGQLCETVYRTCGQMCAITDRDSCIAVAGAPRREVLDKAVSPELERVMEGRQIYQHKSAQSPMALCAQDGRFVVGVAAPILSEGDVLGCVVLAGSEETPEVGEVEYKLVQAVAGFLGRHMES
ncbi:MAG: AbrB/MazE/SpoVT family DNA-binding domain-containing protein [Oscillospiraceae bacterium]|nr:AbrB/MazE/SpoVT family DNA-binding domain-containing protein [Oscillospiraceae bacterium]